MKWQPWTVGVVLAACITGEAVQAEVKLNKLFSDAMVLQRDRANPIWGTGAADEEIKISLGKTEVKAKADAQGMWQAELPALTAGGPHELQVAGSNTITVKDVLIGEVWLCSGQSNMAMMVARSLNADTEKAAAEFPQIRMFTVPRNSQKEPQTELAGSWTVCSPQTVGNFSATAYFFGRELHAALKVPVGLINSSVGGTPIEFWTSRQAHKAFVKSPAGADVYPEKGAGSELRDGASNLYNGMIAPLGQFGIRGAIWYQGERNSRFNGQAYGGLLRTMIADWRTRWNQPEMPFLFVQLPNYTAAQKAPVETNGWVQVREGMLQTLKVPQTGMAVTLDVGDAKDIHPKNKQAVGQRLARWALGTTYQQEGEYSGPLYKSMKVSDGKILLEFSHIGQGLSTPDNQPLQGFAIAGEDKKFVNAHARIVGDSIEVSSPAVPKPVAVRYAWAPNPTFNLFNQDGLPASPFRTDDWKDE